MIDLDFKYETGKAKTQFIALKSRIQDLRPVWSSFLKFYRNDIIPKSFESKGGLMGKNWQGLTEQYRKWKGKTSLNTSGTSGVSLKLTGRLYEAAKGGSGSYDKIGKQSLEFGIKRGVIPYANRHQEGNNMPQRPYFYTVDNKLPSRAWFFLRNEASKYLTEGM